MADNNKTLLLLDGLTLTETANIPVEASILPKQLSSKGKCKAVILRLNEFDYNTETQTDAPYFYWGDKDNQFFEVLRGVNSEVIFCTDLSQIFILYPTLTGRAASITVRAMIYS